MFHGSFNKLSIQCCLVIQPVPQVEQQKHGRKKYTRNFVNSQSLHRRSPTYCNTFRLEKKTLYNAEFFLPGILTLSFCFVYREDIIRLVLDTEWLHLCSIWHSNFIVIIMWPYLQCNSNLTYSVSER